MSLKQLERIRQFELERVLDLMEQHLPKGARILEIGAGTGWQARALTEAGYEVDAVDMATSVYAKDRVFQIKEYDGHRIPFADNTFDAVYSSNVLEHVRHDMEFQQEIHRVLKPSGVAIHVVPSASWRFWSNLAHYPYIAKRVVARLGPGVAPETEVAEMVARATPRTRGMAALLTRALIPSRDGEHGNAWTEVWRFSRWRWRRFFRQTGWKLIAHQPNGLFYTTNYIFPNALPISARRKLTSILGSSCHIFVMRAAKTGPKELELRANATS